MDEAVEKVAELQDENDKLRNRIKQDDERWRRLYKAAGESATQLQTMVDALSEISYYIEPHIRGAIGRWMTPKEIIRHIRYVEAQRDTAETRGDEYRARALGLLLRIRAQRIGNRAAMRVAFRLRTDDAVKADALLFAEATRAIVAEQRLAQAWALLAGSKFFPICHCYGCDLGSLDPEAQKCTCGMSEWSAEVEALLAAALAPAPGGDETKQGDGR